MTQLKTCQQMSLKPKWRTLVREAVKRQPWSLERMGKISSGPKLSQGTACSGPPAIWQKNGWIEDAARQFFYIAGSLWLVLATKQTFAGLILGLFEWNCYFGGSALIQSACFQAAVFMRSPDSLASHPPKARETTTKKAAAARTASWATDGGTDRGGAAGDPRRPQSPEGLTLTR